MPLAAHATWADGQLALDAAIGHPERPAEPLLRVAVRGPATDASAAAALGEAAAARLREAGASSYLAPA
jgi:hydroxymethylbilane synthase